MLLNARWQQRCAVAARARRGITTANNLLAALVHSLWRVSVSASRSGFCVYVVCFSQDNDCHETIIIMLDSILRTSHTHTQSDCNRVAAINFIAGNADTRGAAHGSRPLRDAGWFLLSGDSWLHLL